MLDTTERAGVDEQYSVAGNTSDLTVEADRRGAGDVMIAAGWNESRIGMALLRLHSEWNGLAKPRRVVAEVITARARQMEADDRKAQESERRLGPPRRARGNWIERARQEADGWYANELRLLANGLKGRAVVWQQLLPWMLQKEIDPDVGAEALLYWLNPTCPKCNGHGVLKFPDQPALSTKRCSGQGSCYGTGRRPTPEGAARVLARLDYCVSVARGSLKKRLRPGD